MVIQNYNDLKRFILKNATLVNVRKPNFYTQNREFRMGIYTFTVCETTGYDLWISIYNDKLKEMVLEAEAEVPVGPNCVKSESLFSQFKKDMAKLIKKAHRYNEIMRRLGFYKSVGA